MKKSFLITALILSLTSQAVLSAEMIKGPEDLEDVFSNSFYESPLSAPMPEVELKEGSTMPPCKGMPLFKKVRIKVTNKIREKDYKKTLELIEQEKQKQAEMEEKELEELNKELNINYKII